MTVVADGDRKREGRYRKEKEKNLRTF